MIESYEFAFVLILSMIYGRVAQCDGLNALLCMQTSVYYDCDLRFDCAVRYGCTVEELTQPDMATCRLIEATCDELQIPEALDCSSQSLRLCSEYHSCLTAAGCRPFTDWAYDYYCPGGGLQPMCAVESASACFLPQSLSCSSYLNCLRTSFCEFLSMSFLMPELCRGTMPFTTSINTESNLPDQDQDGAGSSQAPTQTFLMPDSSRTTMTVPKSTSTGNSEPADFVDGGVDEDKRLTFYAIYGGIGAGAVLIVGVAIVVVMLIKQRRSAPVLETYLTPPPADGASHFPLPPDPSTHEYADIYEAPTLYDNVT